MSEKKFFGMLTEIGEIKEANALSLGVRLRITELGVCDGDGAEFLPDRKMRELPGLKRRAPLNSLSPDAKNPSWVIAEQVIPEKDGGFWIRGYGLYDEDGDLVAVANCPPSYKPVLAEGSGKTQTVRMVLMVGSVATYELKIDPSVVLATREFVETKLSEAIKDAFFWRGQISAPADLNNYVNRGAFHARFHEIAAQGLNFPVPYAGKLEVWPGFDGVIFQAYHCYDGAMYWRLKYLAWGDWSRAATGAEVNALRSSVQTSVDALNSRIDDLGTAVNRRIDTFHQDFQAYAQANDTAVGKKADKATSVAAGVGLTGGGSLSQSRTISMGTPSTITGSSTNKAEGETHSHAIAPGSVSDAGIVQYATYEQALAMAEGGRAMSPYLTGVSISARVATELIARAGTDNQRLITSYMLAQAFGGANAKLDGIGYQRIPGPGNLIWQWGVISGYDSYTVAPYIPCSIIGFWATCYGAVGSADSAAWCEVSTINGGKLLQIANYRPGPNGGVVLTARQVQWGLVGVPI